MRKLFFLVFLTLGFNVAHAEQFVWDVAQDGVVGCYLADPVNPGHARPGSNPVNESHCLGLGLFVLDLNDLGDVKCYLADPILPQHKRMNSQAVVDDRCNWWSHEFVWDVNKDGNVMCYLADLVNPNYPRWGSNPVDSAYCE